MVKDLIKKYLKYIYWKVYGKTICNPVLPSRIESILFICKGNICRSPFAEHIAVKCFSTLNRITCSSAGINVNDPKSPPMEAIVSARNFGIDLQGHMSRKINYAMMQSYDLITVMEAGQYNYLKREYREFRDKIFLLPLVDKRSRTSGNPYHIYNIEDPYGKNVARYNDCYRRIHDCLEDLFSLVNSEKM